MTRLALVLGGSASLGAYSAGAVSEILGALRRNRRDDRVTVGVVTGSSAGALSAAVAARSLVVNPSLLPWLEPFWVKGMSSEHLLNPRRRNRSGLLDVGPLEEMVDHLVAGAPASDDAPSRLLDRALRVGISLVDLPGREDGSGVRRHDDEAVFDLDGSHRAGDPVWGRLRDVALAAAGFPGAFPLRTLAQQAVDSRSGEAEAPRWTGDGLGTERPLSLAGRLASGLPGGGGEAWRFVVVDPRSPAGRDADGDRRPSPSPAEAAGRLLEASLGRGAARDWREADDAAERDEVLRALVHRLPEIHGRLDDPGAVGLGRRVGQLAERVAEWEVRRSGGGEGDDPALDHLDRSLEAIRGRGGYRDAFDRVESRAGRTRLAKLIYVLEAAAGLRGRLPGPAHRVAPDEPLAGERMACLGGFLDAGWRAADFSAGRRDARRVLEEQLNGKIAYEPADEEAYRAPTTGSRLSDDARRRLLSHLEAEADAALRELRPGGLAGLLYGLVRPGLRRSTARRALEALERW